MPSGNLSPATRMQASFIYYLSSKSIIQDGDINDDGTIQFDGNQKQKMRALFDSVGIETICPT